MQYVSGMGEAAGIVNKLLNGTKCFVWSKKSNNLE